MSVNRVLLLWLTSVIWYLIQTTEVKYNTHIMADCKWCIYISTCIIYIAPSSQTHLVKPCPTCRRIMWGSINLQDPFNPNLLIDERKLHDITSAETLMNSGSLQKVCLKFWSTARNIRSSVRGEEKFMPQPMKVNSAHWPRLYRVIILLLN